MFKLFRASGGFYDNLKQKIHTKSFLSSMASLCLMKSAVAACTKPNWFSVSLRTQKTRHVPVQIAQKSDVVWIFWKLQKHQQYHSQTRTALGLTVKVFSQTTSKSRRESTHWAIRTRARTTAENGRESVKWASLSHRDRKVRRVNGRKTRRRKNDGRRPSVLKAPEAAREFTPK